MLRWIAVPALAVLILGLSTDIDGAGAHAGHPQKKLFNGHWYRVDAALPMDLTTDNFLYGLNVDYDGDTLVDHCDGGYSYPTPVNTASCSSKWAAPFQESINDWNTQPMGVNFIQTGTVDPNNDITVLVTDRILADPYILGIGLLYNANGDWCGSLPGGYDTCTYRYGVAWQADDGHAGFYGTNTVRRGTVLHEIGHLINLRHESVNPDETQKYPCGQDNTGPIPYSVMAYDCIDPISVGGQGISSVQDWDTCGVNHKYFDPVIRYAKCGYDEDFDGVDEPPDNCPTVYNPTQSNVDGDGFGDACDPDIDGDGILNGSDTEADGDKVLNVDETACGSDPNDGSRRPERVDGIFAGVSDDGDAEVDEALPPGASANDCDGDGYKGSAETSVFSGGGNGDRDPCGTNGWPSDLIPGGIQPNTLNIADLGSFIVPVRRIGTSVGDPGFDSRWDLVPGSTIGEHIAVTDIAATVVGASGYPPMLGSTRAYQKACLWAP